MTDVVDLPSAQVLYPLGDGIGSVALVQFVGNDKMITNAARSPSDHERGVVSFDMDYKEAIRRALQERYRVDTSDGSIYGPKGKLAIAKRGVQRYPTVTLSILGEKQFAVPAHKMVAFALYGEDALRFHVRHLDANTLNLHPSNLILGTPSENEADKPAEARRRAARVARAAQGPRPVNAKFSDEQVQEIRRVCEANRAGTLGRVKRGIVKELAERYGVTNAAISAIAKGKNYGA